MFSRYCLEFRYRLALPEVVMVASRSTQLSAVRERQKSIILIGSTSENDRIRFSAFSSGEAISIPVTTGELIGMQVYSDKLHGQLVGTTSKSDLTVRLNSGNVYHASIRGIDGKASPQEAKCSLITAQAVPYRLLIVRTGSLQGLPGVSQQRRQPVAIPGSRDPPNTYTLPEAAWFYHTFVSICG